MFKIDSKFVSSEDKFQSKINGRIVSVSFARGNIVKVLDNGQEVSMTKSTFKSNYKSI